MGVDHLGSTRMLTDSTGTVQRRYDYQPFGGELLAGIGSRSTGQGYLSGTPDDVGPKFTSQSRDQENTLDWFNVRYLSPAQGRFQSIDPGNAGANPGDPQTWNMYAYVGNNPLSYTDPSGMFVSATAFGAAAGGPPGALIGALIDIGAALASIFRFGGGGGPPPLANLDFPDQFPIGVTTHVSGWFRSNCGFLYGTVCGFAPRLQILDFSGPIFRVTGTGKMPHDHTSVNTKVALGTGQPDRNADCGLAVARVAMSVGLDVLGAIPGLGNIVSGTAAGARVVNGGVGYSGAAYGIGTGITDESPVGAISAASGLGFTLADAALEGGKVIPLLGNALSLVTGAYDANQLSKTIRSKSCEGLRRAVYP